MFKPLFRLSLIIIAFIFQHVKTKAQDIVLDHIEIKDSTGQWKPYEASKFGAIIGNFNFRILLPKASKDNSEYILYLDKLQEVDVYLDSLFIGKTGVLVPLSTRNIPNGKILGAIGNSAQEKIKVLTNSKYIYLKGQNTFEKVIKPDIRLYSSVDWQSETLSSRESILLGQGLIGGALVILTIYHLLMFLFRRDKSYLHYSIYTGIVFLTIWNEMGVSQLLFFKDWQYIHHFLEMSQLLSMLATVAYFFFMRSFIDLKKILPKLEKTIRWIMYILTPFSITMDIVYIYYPLRQILIFGYISAFIILTLGLVATVIILRTKNSLAYYFAIGSLALNSFVLFNTILSVLEYKGIIDKISFERMYLTEAGVMIEIIIFSLGLGHRMRLQQKEKLKLESLANLKTKFFTNISHEFRTPLTVISGISDQIKGHAEAKELIKRNTSSLLGLVNQLLDLSKLDTGKMSLQMTQGNIIPFLQYLTESFYSMAEEKSVRLTFYSETDELQTDYDESKIQQIVFNLVGNAIKFTGAGGKVIIHVSKLNEAEFQIKVKDTGIGLNPKALEKVFDRFYQSNQAHELGSGIGLSLTKELIILMNGSISANSVEGQGSEFIIKLPISTKAAIKKGDYQPIYHFQEPAVERNEEVDPEEGKPIILVVEDNPDIVTYLKSILDDKYSLLVAPNGEEGLSVAQKHIPDLILSDVMMPKLNGFDLCQIIKTTETTNHIPFILLTAKHTQGDKLSGLATGADDYITKPFDRKELLLKVRNILDLRNQIQKQFSLSHEPHKPKDEFIVKVMNYLQKNLAEPSLSINSLSFELGLSKMQVNRKIKALTGQTPALFISEYRLEKAFNILLKEEISVAEVAYKVGYSDPNYFSRVFSKKFNMSPTEVKAG